jgi:hypothetical protein
MYAHELYEQTKPRVVVTYPGRFQPFHQGHAGVFAQLQKKFGAENVYIATSNDTSSAKSPFNFSDKYQLMTAAGVPGNHIIETNMMYSLPEGFDPANTVFVTAVGSPDASRLNPDSFLKRDKKDADGNVIKPAGSPGYYRTWGKDKTPQTANEAGYVVVIPEIRKSIKIKDEDYDVSHGTEARNLWNQIRDDGEARKEFLVQMYKQPSLDLGAIFDKIPAAAYEDIAPDSQVSTSPIHGGQVYEEAGGVGVIASKKQAKDPRYSMSLTKDVRPGAVAKSLRAFRLSESKEGIKLIISIVRDFLPVAKKELGMSRIPKVKLQKHIGVEDGQATFGRYVQEENVIYLGIADRHPVDILRTLAHELVHAKQDMEGKLYNGAGETGSPIENEAHMIAGIIMRHFNKKFPDAIKSKPLELDEEVNPKIFDDPINSLPMFGTKPVEIGDFMFDARTFIGGLGEPNAKGLQIRAYDPKKPKGDNLIGSADFTVKTDRKGTSWLESDDTEVKDEYRGKGVAALMYTYAKSLGNDIKPSPYQSEKGRAMWKKWGKDAEHLATEAAGQANTKAAIYQTEVFGAKAYHSRCLEPGCDWESRRFDRVKQAQDAAKKHAQSHFQPQVSENFADGRNPQDKGDSKRYGIPKKATLSQLDQIGKGSGRKAQLARWQANMRRGRDK